MKISIITPAYKCAEFVEDYFNSIKNQTFFKANFIDYEILYCCDNCAETLTEISKYKYDKKLRIFTNENERAYPYVLRNSLLKYATGDVILFFDADDIMKPHLISTLLRSYDENKITRFKYQNFRENISYATTEGIRKSNQYAHGVFFTSKKLIEITGGFLDWKCGADTEFRQRTTNIIEETLIDEYLFYRRIHFESLTRNFETAIGSEIRENYKILINERINCELKIETQTIELYEIK